MSKYMFDTNVFDYMLANSLVAADASQRGKIFLTNVQISEVANIPEPKIAKRIAIQAILNELQAEVLQLESGAWVGCLRWDGKQKWIGGLTTDYQNIIGVSESSRDSLIVEVAKSRQLTMVSSDGDLRNVYAKRGGVMAITPEDFFNLPLGS